MIHKANSEQSIFGDKKKLWHGHIYSRKNQSWATGWCPLGSLIEQTQPHCANPAWSPAGSGSGAWGVAFGPGGWFIYLLKVVQQCPDSLPNSRRYTEPRQVEMFYFIRRIDMSWTSGAEVGLLLLHKQTAKKITKKNSRGGTLGTRAPGFGCTCWTFGFREVRPGLSWSWISWM